LRPPDDVPFVEDAGLLLASDFFCGMDGNTLMPVTLCGGTLATGRCGGWSSGGAKIALEAEEEEDAEDEIVTVELGGKVRVGCATPLSLDGVPGYLDPDEEGFLSIVSWYPVGD
jgi:hypothetical protein